VARIQFENREGDGIIMSLLSSMASHFTLSSFLFHLAKEKNGLRKCM
jgi:hypothetical protein